MRHGVMTYRCQPNNDAGPLSRERGAVQARIAGGILVYQIVRTDRPDRAVISRQHGGDSRIIGGQMGWPESIDTAYDLIDI